MRFASLGSGSEGNALIVEAGTTRVMLDCGFSLSETCRRLERIGLLPEQLNGILVTHEHADHISGVARFARKYAIPVYLTHGTRRAQLAAFADLSQVVEIDAHQTFTLDDLEIQPFAVPHDAFEPVQYVFSAGKKRLGVLTDTGRSTPHIQSILSACDALVLECNHDVDLLERGAYPSHLKRRVAGDYGHLSNTAAAALLASLDNSRLQHLIAAHLSQKNNKIELVLSALTDAIDCQPDWIGVASQAEGFAWREID